MPTDDWQWGAGTWEVSDMANCNVAGKDVLQYFRKVFKKLCKSNINCDETWPWQPSKEMALPNVYVSPLRCFACGTNQFFFCLSHPDLRRDLFFPQLPKSWVSSLHGFSSRIFQNVSGQSDLRRLQSSHCFYFFHELSPFPILLQTFLNPAPPDVLFTLLFPLICSKTCHFKTPPKLLNCVD